MRILGLHGEEHQKYNGKNGAIMAFDPTTGRYSVQLSMQSISTSDLQVFDVGLIRMRAPTSAPQQISATRMTTTIFTQSSYDHCTIMVKSSRVITISRCMSLSLTLLLSDAVSNQEGGGA